MKSIRILGALLAMAFTTTACGGASSTETAAPVDDSAVAADSKGDAADALSDEQSEPADDAAVDSGGNDIPAVDVIDLATGDTVNLASFAAGDRPIVLWFWAPF